MHGTKSHLPFRSVPGGSRHSLHCRRVGLTDCHPGVLRANGQIIEMCSELGDAEDAVLRLGPGSFDVCLHGILAKLPRESAGLIPSRARAQLVTGGGAGGARALGLGPSRAPAPARPARTLGQGPGPPGPRPGPRGSGAVCRNEEWPKRAPSDRVWPRLPDAAGPGPPFNFSHPRAPGPVDPGPSGAQGPSGA